MLLCLCVCVCACVRVCVRACVCAWCVLCSNENWPMMLKLHLKWRCDNLNEKWNPLAGDKQYEDLDTYSRIRIMHKLCHWRLELDDIADLLRVSGPVGVGPTVRHGRAV